MIRLTTTASVIALCLSLPAQAQRQDNRAVITEVRRILAENYVLAEKRAPLDAVLARGLASGRYDAADAAVVAERVTTDLVAVANDKHLNLRFAPAEAAAMPAPRADDDPAPDAFMDELARRSNQGITDLRVLDGNIRYLNYRGFMWSGTGGSASIAAIDRAAAFLRDGDAIIIDLRENGGGDPRAVRHLTSYFVPASTVLVTFHLRSQAPETVYTEADVPGGRITGKPVYILTSGRTVSAAEEFASHAAHFGFGTLVGTTTMGGAYRNELYPVAKQFVLSVSIGRPEMPGGGNWEAKGVKPAVVVPTGAALDAAQGAALRQIAVSRSDEDRTVAERLATFHEAVVTPIPLTRDAVAYVGSYGPRTVRADGQTLTIRRGEGMVSTLVPIGPDRFALSGDPATQARFAGVPTITNITIERANGTSEPAPRHR